MNVKDSDGFIGLFYFVDGDIFSYQEDNEYRTADSCDEIQPLYNHEYLLDVMKHSSKVIDKIGFEFGNAYYDTFPRGRIIYSLKRRCYVIVTSERIIGDEKKKKQIVDEFGLNQKKKIFIHETEYDWFDEEYY